MRIEACFDSHVHWAAAGEFKNRLSLSALRAPEEVALLNVERVHHRGEWLIGFGWDESTWNEKPNRRFLDLVYPNVPVAFSRCDAHAMWVNTEALKHAGLFTQNVVSPNGGHIVLDGEGWPTGLLIDRASSAVENCIPRPSPLEMRRHLLQGAHMFNEAGYTHIRDMTCDEIQWNEAVKLDESGLLRLAVEEYFWLKSSSDLDTILRLASAAKQTQTANLRVKGIKVFLDGALGSQGAWLSRCYHGSDSKGLRLWTASELREVLLRCWGQGLEVALHAIGDEAAAWLVGLGVEMKAEGLSGPMHIEHAELLRSDTIEKMKLLEISCHLQPAHWLSDRRWLKDKIGELAEFAFPWRRLQEADIPFDFGSDAPIEPASVNRLLQGLAESAEAGVPRLLGLPFTYMCHRDLSWAPNSFSLFVEGRPTQVVFRGENLI